MAGAPNCLLSPDERTVNPVRKESTSLHHLLVAGILLDSIFLCCWTHLVLSPELMLHPGRNDPPGLSLLVCDPRTTRALSCGA